MKKLTALLCCVAWGGGVCAEETPVGASLDLPVLSAYVWRGQVLNDEAVVQPSLTVTKGGFSLNAWQSFNLTDKATGDAAEFSEVDLTASYTGKIGPVNLGGGIIEYLFPNQTLATDDGGVAWPGTRELYLSAGLPDVVLAPVVSLYRDVDAADGFYGALAVSQSATLVEGVATLGLAASIGYGSSDYNAFYFGVDDDALNDANIAATVTFSACGSLTITPGVQYSALLDSDIEDAAVYLDDDQVIGSLKVSYVF